MSQKEKSKEELIKEARREYYRRRREAMTDEERAAIRAYHTNWQRNNPEKVKAAAERFYLKKAEELGIKG